MKTDRIIWVGSPVSKKELEELENAFPKLTCEDILSKWQKARDLSYKAIVADFESRLRLPIFMLFTVYDKNGIVLKRDCKEIESGDLRECFEYRYEDCVWHYNEELDLCCDANLENGKKLRILCRMFKVGVTQEERNELKERVYSSDFFECDIDSITKSICTEFISKEDRNNERGYATFEATKDKRKSNDGIQNYVSKRSAKTFCGDIELERQRKSARMA